MRRPLALLALALPLAGAAQGLIGPETCKACHPGAYEVWKESRHARAHESLPERYRKDARCTGCHAPDQDKGVAAVSCESCHGPGQFYSASYVMRDRELARALGLADPGEKACLGCHNESAPSLERFEYAKKLPLIAHEREADRGGPAKKPQASGEGRDAPPASLSRGR